MLLNNNSIRSVGALGLLMVAASAAHAGSLVPQKASADPRSTTEQGRRLLADRNARFIENKGQWNAKGRFLARGKAVDVWFTDQGLRYDQHFGKGGKFAGQSVDMTFVGGKSFRPVGRGNVGSRMDVLHGKSAVRGIQSYRELYTKNVVDGVDLRGYFDQGKPRYDLILAPGAKPSSIRLAFRGANGLSVKDGALKIGTKMDGFFNGKPIAYQEIDGKRRAVFAKWVVQDVRTAGFQVGAYDASKPLVIDPIVFGTYYGGENGADEVRASIGDDGNVIVVGSSTSTDFPAIYGPYGSSFNPAAKDAFVARLSSTGATQDYSALFGGTGSDIAQYVKIDGDGSVWVAGTTTKPASQQATATDFPNSQVIGAGASTAASSNFFVTRFARDETTVFNPVAELRSVVFGMADFQKELSGFDVRPGSSGTIRFAFTGNTENAVPTSIIANTGSANTGRAAGHFFEGHRAGFIVRMSFNSASATPGTAFTVDSGASQYIQGTRINETRGVVLDEDDNAYTVGTVYKDPDSLLNVDTSAPGNGSFFETTANVFRPTRTSADPYVTGRVLKATETFIRKYTPVGSFRNNGTPTTAQGFSGLIGGNGDDEAGGIATTPDLQRVYTGSAIALGPNRDIYITGTFTNSQNFPTTSGAFQSVVSASPNVYVTQVNNQGTAILASTGLAVSSLTFGGDTTPGQYYYPWEPTVVNPSGIAVDTRGYAFITGNLRARLVAFPSPAGNPNQPTSSTLSAIYFPSDATLKAKFLVDKFVADQTYSSTSGAEFPTTEGFLTVMKPGLSDIQLQTYIGGLMDDFTYAPSVDPATGNVFVTGWTDSDRFYARASNANPPAITYYVPGRRVEGLPDGNPNPPGDNVLTSPRFKNNPDFGGGVNTTTYGYGFWGTSGSGSPIVIPPVPNVTAGVTYYRDGYVIRFNANQPAPSRLATLTLSPATVESAGTSTATVTLTSVAPSGGTRVYIALSDPSKATLSGVTIDPTLGAYVTVAAGQTKATFSIKAATVQTDSSVLVSVRTSQVGDTAEATLNILAFTYSISLSQESVLGTPGTSDNVIGTVSIPAPATENLVFDVSVDDNDALETPVAATVTIPQGSRTATFTLNPKAVPEGRTLVVTVSRNGIQKTATLQINAVNIVSVVAQQKVVRSGGALNLIVTLDGKPVVLSEPVTITFSLNAFSGSATSKNPTANSNTVPFNFTALRLSRTQVVTIFATYRGTTVSTTVTVAR